MECVGGKGGGEKVVGEEGKKERGREGPTAG